MPTTATASVQPGTLNLNVYRGDDFSVVITFTDDATPPAALPLTGTFRAQLRETRTDDVIVAAFDIDTTQAGVGILTLSLPHATVAALPELLVWDLENTLVGGQVQTLLSGRVYVAGDVSRDGTVGDLGGDVILDGGGP